MSEIAKLEIDDFLKDRVVFMEGEFDEFNCNKLKKELLYLIKQDDKKDIQIYINSFGGQSHSLFSILGVLKLFKGQLTTIVNGYAQSAGALLLLAGDKRYALPYSRIMLHEVSVSYGYNKLHELKINVEETKKIHNMVVELVRAKTKIKNIDEFLKEDKYLEIDEALKLGVLTHKIN